MSAIGSKVLSLVGWGFKIVGWVIVSAALYGAFLWVFQYGMGLMTDQRYHEVSRTSLKLERRLEEAQVAAGRLDAFNAEVERRAKQIEMLDRVLPSDPDTDRLQANLKEFGNSVGAELAELVPGQAQKFDFYATLPLEIEARGDFDALAAFTNRLRGHRRLVQLRGIQLERDGPVFTAYFRMETYYYLNP